jgi:spoIIIJ-associated protein
MYYSPEREVLMEDDVLVTSESTEATNDAYAELRAHYENGDELSDAELDTIADLAISYIRSLLAFFGETHVSVDEYDGDDGELILDVSGGDLAVLIGRHGRTLDALQTLVSAYLSNELKFHYPLVVDIEGYKSRRRAKLQSLARSAAARARRQHGRATLPPMSAYERRIVHLTLLKETDITTHSEGVDPERFVVVTVVKD